MAAPPPDPSLVGVIGGGAWGTALAIQAARAGHQVLCWAREPEVVASLNERRENTLFLKGHRVPEGVRATGDLHEVVSTCDACLMVVPAPFVERTLAPVAGSFKPGALLVSCTKGIVNETLETPAEILQRVLPASMHGQLVYLSGPSFAAEVARGLPTAVTIAAADLAVAARVQRMLSSPRFRCYSSDDVAGVELAGALKNVLALAAGMSDGLGMGHNGRAALLTRGLAEITRLAVARGANPLTLAGLAGVGDIMLTCHGDLSRNRTVGLRLGKGEALADIQASMGGAVAEGVLTSRAAFLLARKLGVEVPVIEGIYRCIHEGANVLQVIEANMSRELRPELCPTVVAAAATAAAAAAAGAGAGAPAGPVLAPVGS